MTAQEILQQHGIRPSIQRTLIYAALAQTKSHPSAALLFEELSPKYPALSKTTVYNTLKIFCNAGIVQELMIDNEEARYDADTSEHVHFMCQKCGRVYDVPGVFSAPAVPEGFTVDAVQLFVRGVCAQCNGGGC